MFTVRSIDQNTVTVVLVFTDRRLCSSNVTQVFDKEFCKEQHKPRAWDSCMVHRLAVSIVRVKAFDMLLLGHRSTLLMKLISIDTAMLRNTSAAPDDYQGRFETSLANIGD